MLLDTTILIDYMRRNALAAAFIHDHAPASSFRIHSVVIGELLFGVKHRKEMTDTVRFLAQFPVEYHSRSDCVEMAALMQRHTLSDGVGWSDCLIAAACLRLDLPVVTTNVKHFRAISGLQMIRPY